MKKTTAVLLSATVVLVGILLSAIFSLGSSEQPLELAPQTIQGFSDPTLANLIEGSETNQPDSIKFQTFNFATAGATMTFTGKIVSTTTQKGLQSGIAITCDDKIVGTGSSDETGAFKVLVKRDDCKSGALAHAEVYYQLQTYKSSEVQLPNTPTFGKSHERSLRQNSLSSQLDETAEVPEFSTMTLGAAAMLSLLGILYLRRQ